MNEFFVYIITNKRNGVLYIGITNNLIRRIYEHKHSFIKSFCSKYKLNRLVYYEVHKDIYSAITREKSMKRWLRNWKIDAIEKQNKNWEDLYHQIIG